LKATLPLNRSWASHPIPIKFFYLWGGAGSLSRARCRIKNAWTLFASCPRLDKPCCTSFCRNLIPCARSCFFSSGEKPEFSGDRITRHPLPVPPGDDKLRCMVIGFNRTFPIVPPPVRVHSRFIGDTMAAVACREEFGELLRESAR
jgi:hypothetical protein